MTKTWDEDVIIASADLDVVARLTAARFAEREQEVQRLSRVDELNTSASALSRALAAMNRHALSECRGSHSKWDVGEDCRAFHEALSAYAAVVHGIAEDYRGLAADTVAPEQQQQQPPARRRNLTIV